jgi:hypothetical protein
VTFLVFVSWYTVGSGWYQSHALKVTAESRDAARAAVAATHPEFPQWAVRTATVEECR